MGPSIARLHLHTPPTGTLGLLLRAKRCGFVPAIAPVLERLRRRGVWYEAELVRRVLSAAGEG